MFRDIVIAVAVLAAVALAGCAYHPDASLPDGMMQHHITFEGI
jgi:hypothetical protein